MQESIVNKIGHVRQHISVRYLLIPLLSLACLVLAVPLSAAEKLFSIESLATQKQMLRDAGPKLKAAIARSHEADFVLAKVHPSVVAEQSKAIDINLNQELLITAHQRRVEKMPQDHIVVWQGEGPSQKPGGRVILPKEIPVDLLNAVTLVRHNNYITGLVRVNGETYEIIPVEKGEHAIIKVDTHKFPQGHDYVVPPDYKKQEWTKHLPSAQNARSTIRVMVPVTKQVVDEVEDIPGLVALAFSLANEATANSGADVTFENAGILYTSYDETLSPSYSDLLNRIVNKSDPLFGKPIDDYRNTHRAHLVAALTIKNEYCGLAWRPATATHYGSVTTTWCISNTTFHHEIGHNLGVAHDWPNDPGYANGFYQIKTAPYWDTVLSYGYTGTSKINVYSNPDRTYNGIPTGNVAQANAVRRINEYRHVITEFFTPFFTIQSKLAPNQCIDVHEGFSAGSHVGLYRCDPNNRNQQWFKLTGDVSGRIRPKANPELCLAKVPGSGTTAILQDCSLDDATVKWTESDGKFILSEIASKPVLCNTPNNTLGVTSACTGDQQLWVKTTHDPYPDPSFLLKNKQNNYCAGILNGKPSEGALVSPFSCDTTNLNQRWIEFPNDEGRIHLMADLGLCLAGNPTESGAGSAQLKNCNLQDGTVQWTYSNDTLVLNALGTKPHLCYYPNNASISVHPTCGGSHQGYGSWEKI